MNAIFISVRTGSSRLPRKALRTVGDKAAIEHVIDRARRSNEANQVILCTTTLPEDDILCRLANRHGISYFRGSAEDKLVRWRDAAKAFEVDFFVTCDGDDLLCEPELVDMAFRQAQRNHSEFIEEPRVPCGAFTYGIRVSVLNKVCEMKGSDETEMMAPYFKTGMFKVENLENVPECYLRPEIRITLDYDEDLEFFEKIFTRFNDDTPLSEVIIFLDKNPEVCYINQDCQQRYLDNQKAKTNVIFR